MPTSDITDQDEMVNPFQWNAVLIRNGIPYSVNHYPEGMTYDKAQPYKQERVEIRYEIDSSKEFNQLALDASEMGYKFTDKGRRVSGS